MKKDINYIAINNQEDEDGYTLYPGYAVFKGNIKEKQIISALHKTADIASNSPKHGPGNLPKSTSSKPGKIKR
jgi:hypothetical protein